MSLLGATYLTYLLVAVPLALGATRLLERSGVMVLLDAMDADEMLVVAVNRLIALGYGLVGLGLVAALVPTAQSVRSAGNLAAAVLPALAAVCLWLGVLQLGLLGGYGLLRRRRLQRDLPLPTWAPARPPVGPMPVFLPAGLDPRWPAVPPMPPMPPPAFPPPLAWGPAPPR